ncbi:MAG: NAD-dependent malic enzyme [Ardenticatenaceae bacterium]|nr:NAD-dependent malic enzyme [Ardenticatenaceae bacterium]
MKQNTHNLTGAALLHDPEWNKGTAFTAAERDALCLRGLLPPRVCTPEVQVQRVLGNFERKANDLDRYVYMIGLEDRNETLFYRVVIDHLDKMMPIIYTPTVGQGCQEYGHLFRRPRGLYISAEDRGRIAEVVANWPHDDVRVIVVTDGQRILGLGDLGANGMGIPVGKLSLYTACAGVHPSLTLPITLDVGTNNETLLADPLYIGLPQRRLQGEAYETLLAEFITAVSARYPHVLIQFEDFGTLNAFGLLEKYRNQVCCFNDDIQGTASVTLAGLYTALRITGKPLREQVLLFLGAGEAGTGIANLVVSALTEEGMDEAEARQRCWFVDTRGLVVSSRQDLAAYKRPFAHDHPFLPDFASAVESLRPTAIIGASGQPHMFTRPILAAMARLNERPIVFSLSNPTSKSECTAEEAYCWTDGRAIFASGSPFDPVTCSGQTFYPAQGNNAYIFPGVGLGVLVSGARLVTDEMFMVAAKTLAAEVEEEDLANGRIYPPLSKIREVSAKIGTAVATIAYERGLATMPHPKDLPAAIRAHMYEPVYPNYLGLE